MHYKSLVVFLISALTLSLAAQANDFVIEQIHFKKPPQWLTLSLAQKTISRVKGFLDWDPRHAEISFYTDTREFEAHLASHHSDRYISHAVTEKNQSQIHLGPQVTGRNFAQVFGHELVHLALFQKYKDEVPHWLEEGLANYVPGKDDDLLVDYAWLGKHLSPQERPKKRGLINTLEATGQTSHPHYQYEASTALIQMIASKCSLEDVIQHSLGGSFEKYLSTHCGIVDIDEEFKKWVNKNKEKRQIPALRSN
jgi:hypothetical protein